MASSRMGRSAAAFAYYLMLSFFPLLICVASILGSAHIDVRELLSLFSVVIPPQVTETLISFLDYIGANYSPAMLWAGIILLLTAATGAFGTVMVAMVLLMGANMLSWLFNCSNAPPRTNVSSLVVVVSFLVTISMLYVRRFRPTKLAVYFIFT